MSVRLSKRVLESALPSYLKYTLHVMVFYWGNEVADNLFASREHIGWLIGKTPRQITSDLTALVKLGVLVEVTSRTGGRRRTTRYRLNVDALPLRPPRHQKHGSGLPRSIAGNVEADFQVSAENVEVYDGKHGSPGQETWKFATGNVEVDFHRTVREPEREPEVNSTSAETPRFADKAAEPNGTNFFPIRRLAIELLQQGIPRGPEHVEAVKQACADRGIDYGRHDAVPFDVVHRACDSAEAWVNLQAVKAKVKAS